MALFLLGLVLTIASAQVFNPKEVVRKNYNMARVSGVWFSISMASDNLTRIEENGDLRVFVRSIEHLKNSSLKFNFHFMVQGECVDVIMVCEKRKDGEYSVTYEGENKVLVSETDYRLYITFYMQNIRNNTQTRVLALYGRIPQLTSPFLERFRKICKRYGMSPENIIYLADQDPCYT
uniref:Lipocalin/cytosolic fatty-acid binding domain-containing protein n=1 Tax=Castor canadensis TaxID=51338 RepID=A0A8C0XCT4_CASCN